MTNEEIVKKGMNIFKKEVSNLNDPKQKYEQARINGLKECDKKYDDYSNNDSCREGVRRAYNIKLGAKGGKKTKRKY